MAFGPLGHVCRAGSDLAVLGLVVQIKRLSTRQAMSQKGGFLPSQGALGNGRS